MEVAKHDNVCGAGDEAWIKVRVVYDSMHIDPTVMIAVPYIVKEDDQTKVVEANLRMPYNWLHLEENE